MAEFATTKALERVSSFERRPPSTAFGSCDKKTAAAEEKEEEKEWTSFERFHRKDSDCYVVRL